MQTDRNAAAFLWINVRKRIGHFSPRAERAAFTRRDTHLLAVTDRAVGLRLQRRRCAAFRSKQITPVLFRHNIVVAIVQTITRTTNDAVCNFPQTRSAHKPSTTNIVNRTAARDYCIKLRRCRVNKIIT